MKRFFYSFLAALVVFGGLYGYLYYRVSTGQSALESFEAKMNVDPVTNIEEGNKIEQVNLDEVLFLLVGVDTQDIKLNDTGDGSTGVRSDTMMLCKVNFKDGSIKIMSLPRDSRVPINDKNDKLNHAHSYGGMKLLMHTVRDFTDLDLDYYVRVDYDAVKAIVDAIGGVDVTIDHNMQYNDGAGLNIDFTPGEYTLDGDSAMEFLRYRSYPEGDLGRVKNQQYFMTELLKQTLTPKNILRLPKLFNAYVNYVDTNIGGSIITRGLSLASKLDSESVETMTLPGEGRYLNGVSYYMIYDNQANEMIRENFGEYLKE